jgi:GNAT superfamily N-acetyltransferase
MYNPIELLKQLHITGRFDCGKPPLNEFLKKYALQNQSSYVSRTFVTTLRDARIAGYYSLAASSVEHGEASMRVKKGLAKTPVPVILLARLAVDKEFAGQGLGQALLKDALNRSLQVTEQIGARAVLVHAKDPEAREWYKKNADFEESPTDPLHLFLLMKDIKVLVR